MYHTIVNGEVKEHLITGFNLITPDSYSHLKFLENETRSELVLKGHVEMLDDIRLRKIQLTTSNEGK